MQGTKTLECLLLIPFTEEFSSIREILVYSLEEIGIQPILLDELMPGLQEAVQQRIGRADFIIADLTENNPNVMYEIGFAHALRKPVLPIVQRGVWRIPSDLSGYLFFVYDPSKPKELRYHIKPWISRFVNEWKRKHGDE